jgi:hypothetical protein
MAKMELATADPLDTALTEQNQTEIEVPELAGPKLSARTERVIEAIRPSILAFTRQYGSYSNMGSLLMQRRKEIAPKFMKAFHTWQKETNGDFTQFVRLLDPATPIERDEYRHYRTYQACQYLKRLESMRERTERALAEGRDPAEFDQRATQGDAVTRLVASLLPVIPAADHDTLWSALQHELHWTVRQISRLKETALDAEPLIIVRAPKKDVRIRLVHPIPVPEALPLSA